ncbi:hypothetical protein XENOCAPTIV_020052 [Xenoophorus captivus]|uniref:Keratin n=1 Tax=Xenoophorus captivus TaxID=1517983 RepID=A0ABV0S951_9TELE
MHDIRCDFALNLCENVNSVCLCCTLTTPTADMQVLPVLMPSAPFLGSAVGTPSVAVGEADVVSVGVALFLPGVCI